ncbi:hypothetical protein VNI00_013438 [Paramarasmius palmivorus]|uniref:Uncharacterized protein n=1 Tax=Paramarasmius palmivorus TaxID=297713 RepID=A0AAW0BY91_9AGAR
MTQFSAQRDVLLEVLLPCHMELFNRIVDLYPRSEQGTLVSLRGSKGESGAGQLELLLLRKYADFPISCQRLLPGLPLLTTTFRKNVCLVDASFGSKWFESSMQSYAMSLSPCPGGEPAAELDMSGISTSRLWAADMIRLEGQTLCAKEERGDLMETLYDQCTLVWIRGDLAKLLGVEVVSGRELYARAASGESSVFELYGSWLDGELFLVIDELSGGCMGSVELLYASDPSGLAKE